MVLQDSLLVTLVQLVDRVPLPALPDKRGRGRPPVYPDQLFLKAVVIMIVRHLHNVLEQPCAEMSALRSLLTLDGSFPSRRTWERRLKAVPATLPAQIGCLGRYLIDLIQPWVSYGRAVAIDSTILRAQGGVWHQKHREKGERPHTSIDPEAHWTKSGWHGWVYGWKLHLVSVVAGVWFPIAALLTPANIADSEPAPALLGEVPAEVRFVLGDRHYNTPDLRETCEQADRLLVATHYGHYPHTDDGVEVRRVFHKLRSLSIENFNEHFKGIFDGHGQVPDLWLAGDPTLCAGGHLCLPTGFTLSL
jgi:Transposase DDE domain